MFITDYEIAFSRDAEDLEAKVRELLAAGWQPHGHLIINSDGWYQPMVMAGQRTTMIEQLEAISESASIIADVMDTDNKYTITGISKGLGLEELQGLN